MSDPLREAAMAALYAYKTAVQIHEDSGEDITIVAIETAMLNLEKALAQVRPDTAAPASS